MCGVLLLLLTEVMRVRVLPGEPNSFTTKTLGLLVNGVAPSMANSWGNSSTVGNHEIMRATGWQAHSVRGFISGTVGKKMGLRVASTKSDNGERTYSITD